MTNDMVAGICVTIMFCTFWICVTISGRNGNE